ncbi:MAG TPA: DUF4293 domain-containing protein [Flavisolibacter sp.]
MIQRIQTIWLLLVAIFAAVTFRFPFANGDWAKDTVPTSVPLDASSTTWLTVMTILCGALAFVNIFLFDNRKLQLRLCFVGALLTAGLLALYFVEMTNYTSSVIALWCIFPFAMLGCYILAARGIRKDDQLIRSMDRLR